MPTYRCEYEVTGDLVLADAIGPLTMNTAGVAITFRNGSQNDEGHTVDMIVSVIGPADALDSSEGELAGILAQQLDLLSFATHSRFKIERSIRAIDWEPHQSKRQFRVFHTVDSQYPPEPYLSNEYLETVRTLDDCAP